MFACERPSDLRVSAIEIGLAKNADAEKVKQHIREVLGSDYKVRDRYEQNETLFRTLKTEKLLTFIILAMVLIIATFNIVGSLSMLILDKQKDMDILWKMGLDNSTIQKIFLYEGLLINFIGACIGLILGTFICWLQIQFHLVRFSQNFVVDAYPIDLQVMDYIYVFASVLIIGFLSSWYPVRVFAKKGIKPTV